MCNEWIFTFGVGHRLGGHYVRIKGDYGEARKKMCEVFGKNWAFQYSAEDWEKWENDPNRKWSIETEIEIVGLTD